MKIRYKVVKKILIDEESKTSPFWTFVTDCGWKIPDFKDNCLCYKVMAGLSVFYCSEEVMNQLFQADLLEPTVNEVPIIDFIRLRVKYSILAFSKIAETIQRATFDIMKDNLEEINNNHTILEIRRFDKYTLNDEEIKEIPKEIITLDLLSGQLVSENINYKDADSPFNLAHDYEGVIDSMVREFNLEYTNVASLEGMYKAIEHRTETPLERRSKYVFNYIG